MTTQKNGINRVGTACVCCLGAVMAGASDAPTLPEVRFPGHAGIGANYNVDQQPATTWRVSVGKANVADRCYLPGEPVELMLQLVNPGTQPVTLTGEWRWVWVGDGWADGRGGVRYVPLAEHGREPLASTTLEAASSRDVRFAFDAPDRRGVLALFLESDDGTPRSVRWVTNIAVLFPVAPGQRESSMFMGDCRGVREWQRARELRVLRKLGVKWVRIGEDWARLEPRQGRYDWDRLDREVERVRAQDMLAIYLGGNGADWTRAYGRLSWPRDNPAKFSDSPSPPSYGSLAAFYEQLVVRFAHTIRAINVFNEPWEGGGISNWGGTGAHYRDLQRTAHLGVRRAGQTAKDREPPLVGGNDSDNNIHDNLLCDPSWRSYTDLLTVHGGGFADHYIHRRVSEDIQVWNTEHWYTAQTDRTIQEQLFNLISGRGKTNLVILGNFFTAGYVSGGYYNPKNEADVPDLIPQPNAAGYNAMTHFLEGMRLVEELSPDHLPYSMLFERREQTTRDAEHKAVLVLIGTHIEPDEQVWWQFGPTGNELELDLPEGVTGVFDRYGNPIAPLDQQRYRLAMDTRSVYLTSDSVMPLREAQQRLRSSRSADAVHIAVLDTTDETLRIRVGNPLPSEIVCDVHVVANVNGSDRAILNIVGVKLSPGQTTELAAPLGVTPPPEGLPVSVRVGTPNGETSRTEVIHQRVIARFTPTVDGDSSDWSAAGVPLRVLPMATQEQHQSIEAAMPWEAMMEQAGDRPAGRWAMAHDMTHLHIVAELRIAKRGSLPWDQTREDWFELHPGGYSYKRAPEWPFTGESLQLAIDCTANEGDAIYPETDPRRRRYPMFRTDHLLGFYETRQGGSQCWWYRRPGGAFRHRFPFTPMRGIDQQVAPGVRVVVRRDETRKLTTFEASVPLALMPELDTRPGAVLPGADIKLTTVRWSGLFSATGRGASKRDGSVFQPYWMPGYSTELPWRFSP